MITAYAVTTAGDGMPALLRDRARADDYAAACHGIVHKLVDEAAILRKFDGYVPADQASSMRYRIVELEEQAGYLRAQVSADNNEILDLRAQVAALQEELARKVLAPVGWHEAGPRVPKAGFDCWCAKCDAEETPFRFRMNLCPECGDKRCPRAEDHEKACHVVDASLPAANAAACRSPAQDVMRCPNAACGWLGECIENPPVEVVTDPAAITAAFAADDDEWRRIDDLAAWASRCAQDEIDSQCDAWAGLPMEDAGLLS